MCFYVPDTSYSPADDESCFAFRRLLIFSRRIGISDMRWVVFWMFEIRYVSLGVLRILLVCR